MEHRLLEGLEDLIWQHTPEHSSLFFCFFFKEVYAGEQRYNSGMIMLI